MNTFDVDLIGKIMDEELYGAYVTHREWLIMYRDNLVTLEEVHNHHSCKDLKATYPRQILFQRAIRMALNKRADKYPLYQLLNVTVQRRMNCSGFGFPINKLHHFDAHDMEKLKAAKLFQTIRDEMISPSGKVDSSRFSSMAVLNAHYKRNEPIKYIHFNY